MFTISETFNSGRYSFNIYNHKLTMEELDSAISELLFDNKLLTYLFTGISAETKVERNRILMLRRFIPTEYFNRENIVLENWEKEKEIIATEMNRYKGYYSFFAEAVMAYLNLVYLDNRLTFGIIDIDETLTDQRTGVDSCMYSSENIILGEAKFYQDFNSGKNKIIEDFNNKSILTKIRSLYVKTVQSNLIVKDVRGDILSITLEEFKKMKITLSGFILHNTSNTYDYTNITSVTEIAEVANYNIVFYHLPITDKKDLINKIIKRALELIVDETS